MFCNANLLSITGHKSTHLRKYLSSTPVTLCFILYLCSDCILCTPYLVRFKVLSNTCIYYFFVYRQDSTLVYWLCSQFVLYIYVLTRVDQNQTNVDVFILFPVIPDNGNGSGEENCAVMMYSKWEDVKCTGGNYNHEYICKK